MAQEYLDRLNALLEQLGSSNFNDVNLECGHFFSGAAVYARGRMCMSWTPVGFAINCPRRHDAFCCNNITQRLSAISPKAP